MEPGGVPGVLPVLGLVMSIRSTYEISFTNLQKEIPMSISSTTKATRRAVLGLLPVLILAGCATAKGPAFT